MESGSREWKMEDRGSQSSILDPLSSFTRQARVKRVTQRIAEEIEAHQREEDEKSRQENLQRGDENIRRGVRQEISPARCRWLDAETEKAQRGFGANGCAGVKRRGDDERRERIGKQVAQHDAPARSSEALRREHELLLAKR